MQGYSFTLTTSEALVVYHLRDVPHLPEHCALCQAEIALASTRDAFNLAIAGARTDEDSFIEGFEMGTLVSAGAAS